MAKRTERQESPLPARSRYRCRQVRVYNDSGEDIPGHSFAEITDLHTDNSIKVDKPSANSIPPHLLVIIGKASIKDGAVGTGFMASADGLWVNYNSTAPSKGDSFGCVSSQWYGEKDKTGFIAVGSDTDNGITRCTAHSAGGGGAAGTPTTYVQKEGDGAAGSSGDWMDAGTLLELRLRAGTGPAAGASDPSGLEMAEEEDRLGIIREKSLGNIAAIQDTTGSIGSTNATAYSDHHHPFNGAGFAGDGIDWGTDFSVDLHATPGLEFDGAKLRVKAGGGIEVGAGGVAVDFDGDTPPNIALTAALGGSGEVADGQHGHKICLAGETDFLTSGNANEGKVHAAWK